MMSDTTPTVSAPADRQARYALILLTTVYALGYADRNIINLLLEPIKAEFQLSDLVLGMITGLGFTAFQVVLGIPIARWADSAKRVYILAGGLMMWSVMTGLSGLAASAALLAVTRMGVGVGEACLTGPSHSLLSDFYAPERRPRAFSIMAAGGEIGIIAALLIGGWVSHAYGWRAAFVVAGMPGALLSLLLVATLKEPLRGGADDKPAAQVKLSFAEAFGVLWRQKSFVLTVLASMVMGLQFFAMQVWGPAFLKRIYHLNTAEIGSLMAIIRTVLAVSGALLGGYLASLMVARRGPSWFTRFPALACLGAGLTMIAFLFSPSLPVAIVFLALVNLAVGMQLGPVFSAVQMVAPVSCRGFAAAIFVSLTQLFGLGIGSVIVGGISDLLTAQYGDEALRYALLVPAAGAIVGGALYWIAGDFVARDIDRAQHNRA